MRSPAGRRRSLIVCALLLSFLLPDPIGAAPPFASPDLRRVWERYDKPVEDGATLRSWTWGPQTLFQGSEPYGEAPGGSRLVQYFDKSRMEITNPTADPASPWYVTNGLLATELITGQIQVGDAHVEVRAPAQIPVAGDPDDTGSPTYASLTALLKNDPLPVGTSITETIDRAGITGEDESKAGYNITAAYYVPETNHTIASPFWAFLNLAGAVYQNGAVVNAQLYDPIFFVTGFPITRPYWASVKVAGRVRDVLVQCYQRRCLTFTPSNPAGFQVEMGNIGRHYYHWRYSGSPPGAPALVRKSPSDIVLQVSDLPPGFELYEEEWNDDGTIYSRSFQNMARVNTGIFFVGSLAQVEQSIEEARRTYDDIAVEAARQPDTSMHPLADVGDQAFIHTQIIRQPDGPPLRAITVLFRRLNAIGEVVAGSPTTVDDPGSVTQWAKIMAGRATPDAAPDAAPAPPPAPPPAPSPRPPPAACADTCTLRYTPPEPRHRPVRVKRRALQT